MFEGFQATADRQSRRRFAASGGISLALYGLIAIGIIAIASRPREKKKPPPVKVVFKKPAKAAAAKPKPPPPKAPPPRPRKRTAARKASAGPAAAPKNLPLGGLAEGNASDFRAGGVTAIDWESEAGGGLGGAVKQSRPAPPPPPPPKVKSANIGLPKGAIPPRPESDNPLPAYPEVMRKKGVEGLVVLRVLVGTDGTVSDVSVVSGEEPFLTAALEVVRAWRYTPAMVEGRPKAVHRIIRVPFRLRS